MSNVQLRQDDNAKVFGAFPRSAGVKTRSGFFADFLQIFGAIGNVVCIMLYYVINAHSVRKRTDSVGILLGRNAYLFFLDNLRTRVYSRGCERERAEIHATLAQLRLEPVLRILADF
jgi:hypothetical protein